MNLNYFAGSTYASIARFLKSRSLFPLSRKLPFGSDWLYDVQRFSGTREAGYIVDAGANVGQTAKLIIQYFPRASVYCFEPVSSTCSQLTENMRKSRNVECIAKALGERPAKQTIQLHHFSEINTLVKNDVRTHDLTGETEEIDIVTLDGFCATRKIPHLDVLKLDVQGWELNVLLGCSELIRAKKIRFVYSEVAFNSSESDMQHFSELDTFMESSGFMLSGFYEPFRFGDRREFLGFCNALYVNASFVGS